MDFPVKFFSLLLVGTLWAYGVQNYGAYIPPMCYTKVQQEKRTTNPCYVCHTNGKVPNYFNELHLQAHYEFPKEMMDNPYSNLFIDNSFEISQIDDEAITKYIRTNNYTQKLIDRYGCYFDFDDEGFDKNKAGDFTLWRAFVYRPFMGTFFPTNGSTDDVMIRLPKIFALNSRGDFDIDVYKHNLDTVVQNIKQTSNAPTHYVGKAQTVSIDKGLYPVGTEFLHTVRYIDYDAQGKMIPSKRIKEVRYGIKKEYKNYSQLYELAKRDIFELPDVEGYVGMQTYRGDAQTGIDNRMGWRYKGYIEDTQGALRLQSDEETLSCMGCHAKLGVTTDSTFALARMVRWGYEDIYGLGDTGEYAKYLRLNPTGNEYATNDEVYARFFYPDGTPKTEAFEALKKDITTLLVPTKERALLLNKAYYVLVRTGHFDKGKEATIKPYKNVHKRITEVPTGIKDIIINDDNH